MVFFLCNAIEGQLISTGAFEISFNGEELALLLLLLLEDWKDSEG